MRAWIERQGEMKSGLGVEWKWKQIQTDHKDYFKEAKKKVGYEFCSTLEICLGQCGGVCW